MKAFDDAILTLVCAKLGKFIFGRIASWWAGRAAKEVAYTVEHIAGFYVRGSTTIVKGVYTRTIQTLASLTEGSSIFTLLRKFEAEAIAGGAKKIVIKGVEIIEKRFINPEAAKSLGYTFEQTGSNSIQLVKTLK